MTAFDRLDTAIDTNLPATRVRREHGRTHWVLGEDSFEIAADGAHRADLRVLRGVLRPTVLNYDVRLDDLDAFVGDVAGVLGAGASAA
ncbi:MAG TPA: hypothetical protein VMD91_11595 [Candidatus Sulfotelmatobacter sp.]|nr:hypothetical protein [Candidatus Sulfotelmatobacter sp.]